MSSIIDHIKKYSECFFPLENHDYTSNYVDIEQTRFSSKISNTGIHLTALFSWQTIALAFQRYTFDSRRGQAYF